MKKIKAKILRTVNSGDPVELLEVHEELEDEILSVREVISEF